MQRAYFARLAKANGLKPRASVWDEPEEFFQDEKRPKPVIADAVSNHWTPADLLLARIFEKSRPLPAPKPGLLEVFKPGTRRVPPTPKGCGSRKTWNCT